MDLTTMLMIRGLRGPVVDDTIVARVRAPEQRVHEPHPAPAAEPAAEPVRDERTTTDGLALLRRRDARGPDEDGDGQQRRVEEAMLALEELLVSHQDRPGVAEFLRARTPLVDLLEPGGDSEVGNTGTRDTGDAPPPLTFGSVRELLGDALIETMRGRSLEHGAFLTRMHLVLDVADPALLSDSQIRGAGPDVVWDRLNRRFIALPELDDAWPPAVPLVREAKVGPLAVVRNEWCCYRLGEIATLTNVLAGERFSRTHERVQETTTTDTTETERTELTERTDEDRTSTELSREVDRATSQQAHLEAGVNVSGSYGLVKFGAHASGGFSSSFQENIRTATKTAREIVSKAVSRVETRVREERVRTITERTTETDSHVINNDRAGASHRRGVYRWVDRVDRYQVFHYPERLMLEFQLPEPGQYLRHRLGRDPEPVPSGVPRPPDWEVSLDDVTSEGIGELMSTYRATNIPPHPDEKRAVVVSQVLKASSTVAYGTAERKVRDEVWNPPFLEATITLTVPKGYASTGGSVTGTAMPMRANWRVESTKDVAHLDDKYGIEGFHHITATVAVGGVAPVVVQHPASDAQPQGWTFFTVQLTNVGDELGREDRARRQYGDAVAQVTGSVAFGAPVTDSVTAAVEFAGAASGMVSIELDCALTDEARSEWQQSAHDALFAAWSSWDEQYRAQLAATPGPRLSAVDSTSPARNRELVVEEIQRQVISWMLDEQDFQGRDAMADPVVPPEGTPAPTAIWETFDRAKALESAATIQFLQQAFEWNNITYIPYPYYWARRGEWDDLVAISGADADFVRFLRAGSLRVVVPARQAFEKAVLYWLAWGEPFLGHENLPLPGDELYLSVATEIFDLSRPPDDGTPGRVWEAKVPTTLLWLDDDRDEPPRNPAPRLGHVAGERVPPLCPPVAAEDPDEDRDEDRDGRRERVAPGDPTHLPGPEPVRA